MTQSNTRGASLARLAAGVAIVAAAGLGAYAIQLRGRSRALETQLRGASVRIDAGTKQLTDARRLAAQTQFMVSVLGSPDLARIDFSGQKVAPDAVARAFWSRSHGLVFIATNLPGAPEGRTYQLWGVTAQKSSISVGVLKPDPDGRVNSVFNTPADMPQPIGFTVTLEKDGASAPTGAQYLVGSAN